MRIHDTTQPKQSAPPGVHAALRSAGRPLDAQTRAGMETRFGAHAGRLSSHNAAPQRASSQLALGPVNDPYEREAEQVAGRVTGISAPGTPGGSAAHSQFDFSRVRIHADAQAAASARAVNAQAYTVGHDIVFDAGRYAPHSRQGQRLLAHELTHVAQQTGSGGGGQAAGVVQRYTAFSVADQTAGKSMGWLHPGSADLRVSDDGQMVVEDKGWGANKTKRAWTTSKKIADANAVLAAQGSRVKLVSKGGSISGNVPKSPKTTATLEEIEPVKASGGGALDLASDCGSACRQVMGSGTTDVAVVKQGKGEKFTTPKTYHGGDPTTPEEWSEEIYKMEFGAGLSRADAYAKYAALSPAAKDAFDKKYGINKYATPRVGQGLTVSTEKDMPGFTTRSGFTWNFHYAAVVLTGGPDYVTLENAAGWAPTDWIFFMYGPASKSQTFHEFHGATLTHGSHWTTMVVQPEKTLHLKTNAKDAPLVTGSGNIKLALGTAVKVIERSEDKAGLKWSKVTVESGAHTGKTGMIQSSFLS